MAPISVFDAGLWEGNQYNVDVLSNFSVSDFSFSSEEKLIHFDVEVENETVGFSRVTIPKNLLNVTDNNWNVRFINGSSSNITIHEDPNNTYLYLNYDHRVTSIEIYGTTAIPEFSSWIFLPLFLSVTLVVVIWKKRLPWMLAY